MKAMFRSVIAAVLTVSVTALHAEPLGTEFTFQGKLRDGNRDVDELIDMQFTLYDAAVDGNAVSVTLVFDGQPGNQPSVDVVKGSFSMGLDFGSSIFDGSALWVQVEVRTHLREVRPGP